MRVNASTRVSEGTKRSYTRSQLTCVLRLRNETGPVAALGEVTLHVGIHEPNLCAHVQGQSSQHLAHVDDTRLFFGTWPFGGCSLELLHLLAALVGE